MPFTFFPEKITQAAAIILSDSPNATMSYMKLIKLMYIADRESIAETRSPITGDRPVAMRHGPVLSTLYDYIMLRDVPGVEIWEEFIQTHGLELRLVDSPGDDRLCPYETEKLREITRRHKDDSQWDVRNLTHDFAEWKRNDPGHSSQDIPLRHIADALGIEDIDELLQEREDSEYFTELFEG